MSGYQPFIPGLEPKSELDFVFFAILPSPRDARRIASYRNRLRQQFQLTGPSISADRLHVSLHGVCAHHGVPSAKVDLATKAGSAMSIPPFDIVFERAMSFKNALRDRPFVLRAADDTALTALYRRLGDAMTSAGFRRVASRFTPHMTLLYDDVLVAERQIEALRWTADNFALIHSLRGRGRSTYKYLASWPLRG